jgi:hypothetical protein
VWILPIIVFFLTRSACRSLQRSRAHPLRAWQGAVVRRGAGGELNVIAGSPDTTESHDSQAPVGTLPSQERE